MKKVRLNKMQFLGTYSIFEEWSDYPQYYYNFKSLDGKTRIVVHEKTLGNEDEIELFTKEDFTEEEYNELRDFLNEIVFDFSDMVTTFEEDYKEDLLARLCEINPRFNEAYDYDDDGLICFADFITYFNLADFGINLG